MGIFYQQQHPKITTVTSIIYSLLLASFLEKYSVTAAFYAPFSRPVQRYYIQKSLLSSSSSKGTASPSRIHSSTSSYIEDDEDEIPKGGLKQNPPPADMRYIPFNILRQIDNYKKIRNVGGVETVNDVYVRDPATSTFWFAGKVARCTGTVSLEDAIARQWHLIEQHAARLRLSRGNNELGPKFGELEIWAAPGDSELDVAYRRSSCIFQKMPRVVEGVNERVKSAEVGYEGELYRDDEEGFRTERDEEGKPVGEEIQGKTEESGQRRASDGEMDELMKRLGMEKRPI